MILGQKIDIVLAACQTHLRPTAETIQNRQVTDSFYGS